MWWGELMANAVDRQLLCFRGNANCAATAGGHVAVCPLF